jgi:cobalt-zinc-cadmium efflux system outer membrane protein
VPCSLLSFSEDAVQEVACPRTHLIPPGVSLEDGVDEDEAIATALSNNSAFQAILTQRGMAQGDLVQAGLLTNPNLQNFIPVSVKQWEWTLYAPLEPLLLRPYRVAAAEREVQRVANAVVQNGLDLVRDVRVAYVNVAAAQERASIASEAVTLRQGIADLTARRLANGDISELEATTARVDALNAVAAAAIAQQDTQIAAALLGRLMGIPPVVPAPVVDPIPPVPPIQLVEGELLEEAYVTRPDLRAANWAVAGASRRLALAKKAWLKIDGVIDANGKGEKGFEIGPGIRFDIPIFNRNQGGVLRAESELMQASYTRDAISDQITQDVRTALAQWTQAQQNLAIIERDVLPTLNDATGIAKKGYEDGGADYFLVLQTTSQYLDARIRQVDQRAALRRAYAELERSVGHKLTAPSTSTDTTPTVPTPSETIPGEPSPVELLPPAL